MGREVRCVSLDWQHPIKNGKYIPMRQLEMPVWPDGQATYLQMYETTSQGTPISPVMNSPEKLAHWLVENKISAYGDQTASYEAWLMDCRGKTILSGRTASHLLNGIEYEQMLQQQANLATDAFDKIDKQARATREHSRERG